MYLFKRECIKCTASLRDKHIPLRKFRILKSKISLINILEGFYN